MQIDFVLLPSRSALAWRGLANVLLGTLLLMWPQATVYVVILIFAINLILVGLFSILEPLFDKKNPHALTTVVLGIFGVTFGTYLIIKPEFAAGLIGVLIAFWALLFGTYDVVVSLRAMKSKKPFSWVFLIAGIISLLFGLYMLFSPVIGILTIVWLFGLYVAVVGVLLLLTSLLMKLPRNTKYKGVKHG